MSEQDLAEWVAESLRYLKATCGALPWADATTGTTEEQ